MTREGTLVTIDGTPALRFERHYRHPLERVWRAISEADELRRWFPADVVGERKVGAELVFDDDAQRAAAREAGEATRADGPMFRGTVVTYDPPKVFSFTWGGELLRFELLPDGDGTVLVFTHLLSHQSVAARNGAGWHACLTELDQLLGAPTPEEDVMAVYADYVERLGPALGTRSGNGAMTWERASHVEPQRVDEVTSRPTEVAAWGGAERTGDPHHWEIEPLGDGTRYRLTVDDIGDDAERAAEWHALLVQLDMYLAAGELVPVGHERWIDAYRARR